MRIDHLIGQRALGVLELGRPPDLTGANVAAAGAELRRAGEVTHVDVAHAGAQPGAVGMLEVDVAQARLDPGLGEGAAAAHGARASSPERAFARREFACAGTSARACTFVRVIYLRGMPTTREQFAEFMRKESQQWGAIVRDKKITGE